MQRSAAHSAHTPAEFTSGNAPLLWYLSVCHIPFVHTIFNWTW